MLDLFATITLGKPLNPDASKLLLDYVGDGPLNDPGTQTRLKDSVAMLLASPAFQWT